MVLPPRKGAHATGTSEVAPREPNSAHQPGWAGKSSIAKT
jgi:hypothetical protein